MPNRGTNQQIFRGGLNDHLYTNLPGALSGFTAGMAAGGTGLVYVIGDSIGMGFNASDHATTAYVALLLAYLQGKYGVSNQPIPGNSASWHYTGLWNLGTNKSNLWQFDIWDAKATNNLGGPDSAWIDLPACTRIDLFYLHFNDLGVFKVAVDGGAAVDIDDGAAGNAWTSKTIASGLANVPHRLDITVPLTKYCWLHAVWPMTVPGVALFNDGF